MTRSILLLILFCSVQNASARDLCDLSLSIGVQLPSGQIIGVKDLVSEFKLVVQEQSCSLSSSGDDCVSHFDPLLQISEAIKHQLALRLKADKSSLKFTKKPSMREPASTQAQAGSGRIRALGKCI